MSVLNLFTVESEITEINSTTVYGVEFHTSDFQFLINVQRVSLRIKNRLNKMNVRDFITGRL